MIFIIYFIKNAAQQIVQNNKEPSQNTNTITHQYKNNPIK